jgi:uncharacterized protein (DUF302 family)
MFRIVVAMIVAVFPLAATAAEGVVTKESRHSVVQTMDRLEALVKARGITVFARIDHAGGAQAVGLAMKPTQLLIFGHPKAGTPLMLAAPSIALDLPLKAVAWEDPAGKVWVSFNSAAFLAGRHGLAPDLAKPLGAVEALVNEAAN